MTTDIIEGDLDYNVVVALEKLEANAVAVDRAKAKQLMQDYRAKLIRSDAHRKGELHRFQESSNWIRRTKNTWSAISDRELKAFGYEARERARKARNKRDQRARKAKPATPAPAIASVVITREGFTDRLAKLRGWLALPGHLQRHHRGREAEIMRSWVVYRAHLANLGRRPSFGQFAGAFTTRFGRSMTRSMAQNRLKLLGTLMAAGGPLR
jgi:hypothetical protein